jgi:hypothetical protein
VGDDLAADVRADWRDALIEGWSAEDAEARVLARHDASLRDPVEEPQLHLALAAAQHETGHLSGRVRDRALEIIASGVELQRFAGDAARSRARARALDRLEAKLRGPQPAPKRVRRAV